MNEYTSLENRLGLLGAALRARPSLTDRLMNEVRRSAAVGSTKDASTLARPSGPRAMLRSRRQYRLVAAACAITTIGIVLLVAMTLFQSTSVGWAEVTKAIQAQKWIRGAVIFGDGQVGTMWLSSQRQVWAYHLGGSSYFYNGPEQSKYELQAGQKSITKLPLGEDDAEKVLSMNALSEGKSAVGHWLFGTEKIVSQERTEVTEGGKTWIEFQMTLWRGEMNQATLRVDPETRLPVYLLLTSPKGYANGSIKWQFDYPAEGPADIYALGVPRKTKIDDRMPSNDALAVLRAIAKSRESIEDFRLLVGETPATLSAGSMVWRKGDRWRVDSYWNMGKVNFGGGPPAGQKWAEWFEELLKQIEPTPIYVCDGKTVWENSKPLPGEKLQWKVSEHIGPQDLMSGEGRGMLSRAANVKIASLLFPDLSLKPGWEFSFDPRPADAPGTVLLKQSTRTAGGSIAHEWYYVDPAKGHAVVRAELFLMAPGTAGNPEASRTRQTIRMEDFQKTEQGFWYPTVVQNSMPGAVAADQPELGATRQVTKTIHYHFDFAADMPDSLFTVEGAPASE